MLGGREKGRESCPDQERDGEKNRLDPEQHGEKYIRDQDGIHGPHCPWRLRA